MNRRTNSWGSYGVSGAVTLPSAEMSWAATFAMTETRKSMGRSIAPNSGEIKAGAITW